MTAKTTAEHVFEKFCKSNGISCKKVLEGKTRKPDYYLHFGEDVMFVEIKQIDKDMGFGSGGVSTRTSGSHLRRIIQGARGQLQPISRNQRLPTVLLIYNNLDPIQIFATDPEDFVAAMYGERTVVLKGGRIVDSFRGRNGLFRADKNTSFSAVGWLHEGKQEPRVVLYENVFARVPLEYQKLPLCFEVVRVEVE